MNQKCRLRIPNPGSNRWKHLKTCTTLEELTIGSGRSRFISATTRKREKSPKTALPHIWIFAHAWWDHQDLRGLERPHVNQCRVKAWIATLDFPLDFFSSHFLSLLPIAVILANHLPFWDDFWTSTFLKKPRHAPQDSPMLPKHCLKLRWHQWPQHQTHNPWITISTRSLTLPNSSG